MLSPLAADLVQWEGPVPTPLDRVVVVAPHPDDEVIGAAGLMCWLDALGVPVAVVAVTDGEASHAASPVVDPEELRRTRAAERAAGLRRLGLGHLPVTRLGLPDGAVATRERELVDGLVDHFDHAATVVATWELDGHPDHEAVGRAVAAAARAAGAAPWAVPVWSKVAGTPFGPAAEGRVSALALAPALQAAKREALACHRSQLHPLGPGPHDGPVLAISVVDALLDGREQVRW